jgi:DNA-binding NarL/FixJ family response regulator
LLDAEQEFYYNHDQLASIISTKFIALKEISRRRFLDKPMPTEWKIILAAMICFALAFVLYRQWRAVLHSRGRQFHTTAIETPLVIGHVKWDALTPRQQQVARLAARGLSNAEIAQHLGVKPNTVDAHLKKIYTTLGVHSRAELSYRIKDQLD